MDVPVTEIMKHEYNSWYGPQICPKINLYYFLNTNWVGGERTIIIRQEIQTAYTQASVM
jgi:hypothetical protein